MGGSQPLSSDIIFEILTRVNSLKALDTCKAVSKQWKEIMNEPTFASTHCRRTGVVSGYYVQDMKYNAYVAKIVTPNCLDVGMEKLPAKTKILASSSTQGIMCCERELAGHRCRYYTFIPVTRQWRALPNPKTRYPTVAVAIIVLGTRPLRFRIIRFSERGFLRPSSQLFRYGCEIFDSEKRAWSVQRDILWPYTEFFCINPAISTGTSVHWLTTDANVFSYDATNDGFDKFPLHEDAYSCESKNLFDFKGKLGFTCHAKNIRGMDLWVADKSRSWRKETSVNTESLERVVKNPSPAGFYNSYVAFLTTFNELVFYKLHDSCFSSMRLDALNDAREIFPFRSDVEPAELSLL